MYEQVEKTPEKKSQLEANAVSQRQNSNAPTSRFVDKRPEAIQMRKLRDLAKNSPQDAKLRELHNLSAAHSVTQKKSNVKRGFGLMDNRPEAVIQRGLQKRMHGPPLQKNVVQLMNLVKSEKIKAVFEELKQITVDGRRMDLPISEMCEVRAKLIDDYLKQKEIKTQQFNITFPRDATWEYHIATAVQDENETWWVMDTSFTNEPLTHTDWAKLMYKRQVDMVGETSFTAEQRTMLEALVEKLADIEGVGDDTSYPEDFEKYWGKLGIDLDRLKEEPLEDNPYFAEIKEMTLEKQRVADFDKSQYSETKAMKNVSKHAGITAIQSSDIENLILHIKKGEEERTMDELTAKMADLALR